MKCSTPLHLNTGANDITKLKYRHILTITHSVRASLPGRKHAVVLSVQLVSNDLIVRAHASLDRGSHDLLGDLPPEGLQVLLQDAEAGMSRPRGKTRKFT